MQKTSTRILSVLLSVLMLLTLVPSALVSYAAGVSLNITDENGNDITEIQQLTEYKTLQLKYTTTGELPEGTTVKWESNLPLLADVDDNGKVTAYDSSKTAIIQLWLDENVRVLPLVGDHFTRLYDRRLYLVFCLWLCWSYSCGQPCVCSCQYECRNNGYYI